MTMIATNAELEARLNELEARLPPLPTLQVNPPVTIGELTDVPAPGSGIASAWAQEVSHRVEHRFANTAARDLWTTRQPGALCYVAATKSLQMWDGTGWVVLAEGQIAWNAAWSSGITIGNGSWLAVSQRAGGRCSVWARFTFGSTTGSTGPPRIDLPYPAQVLAIDQFTVGMFHNADGGFAIGTSSDVAPMTLYNVKTDLAVAGVSNISATSPWAWGVSDRIYITGEYLLNSPYG